MILIERVRLVGLTKDKYLMRKELEEKLGKISKEEEIKWLQRSKEKELLEGDALTTYFMSKASSRKRKNRIISLNTVTMM